MKNIQLQNRQKDPHPSKVMSLNNPQNLENVLSRDFNRIKRKASKIVTLLPENALTPIPKKDIKDGGLANKKDNKDLNDAQRTAVFIRRMEYATTMRRKMDKDKNLKDQAKKIALIQEWWKTMFKIIKLQKNIRGFLFRKKLMNNLEHQEKLLQFITEFDKLGESVDTFLPKGASDKVNEVGLSIVKKYGFDKLSDIAKLNFKNTEKIKELM